ncbi:MAG: hypothetical protein LBF74_02485, partial [Treponema sp.]|nr:hypothetical protein [Treponema sp.]
MVLAPVKCPHCGSTLVRKNGTAKNGKQWFHFGTREYNNLEELLKLLKPFEIKTVYSDNNFAYKSRITGSEVVTGKKNTQKIERSHLSLRTWCSRLVGKGIGFSKDPRMHKIVVAQGNKLLVFSSGCLVNNVFR